MPDMHLCRGTGCPAKDSCYRFTATPKEFRQAYFSEPPIKDGKCEYYWGDNQTYVLNMLKSITQGDEK